MPVAMEECRAVWSLVREIVRGLVDAPELVTVATRASGDRSMVLTVTVAASDVGKVVGRSGRTAQSLRTILNAIGVKMKLHCELVITQVPSGEAAR